MYFLHAINSDRQTRLLNVLGQIAMIVGDKKNIYRLQKLVVMFTVYKTGGYVYRPKNLVAIFTVF